MPSLSFGAARVDLLARRQQLSDIAIHRQVEMRNRLHRSRQTLGDRASHAIVRHEFVRVRLIQRQNLLVGHGWRHGHPLRSAGSGRAQALARLRGIDVARNHAAVRTRALHAAEIDAGLLREAARQWRRKDAIAR